MSKRAAEGGHSAFDRHNDGGRYIGNGDSDKNVMASIGYNPQDPAKTASKEIMSQRKIAPIKRRGTPAGFRGTSPGPGINALGNIFDTSTQNAINGTNGAAGPGLFGQSAGANPQPQANPFGVSQPASSFPPSFGGSNSTPFTFGASQAQPNSQAASFSFPVGGSSGFTFSAGTPTNNPFAQSKTQPPSQLPQSSNLFSQSSQGSTLFGGSTTFDKGQSGTSGSMFGQSAPAKTPTFQFGSFANNQTATPQTAQIAQSTTPDDGSMQISPPVTPARGTGVNGDQRSITETMNGSTFGSGQTQSQKSLFQEPNSFFAGLNQQKQDAPSQSTPSSQALMFGSSLGQNQLKDQTSTTSTPFKFGQTTQTPSQQPHQSTPSTAFKIGQNTESESPTPTPAAFGASSSTPFGKSFAKPTASGNSSETSVESASDTPAQEPVSTPSNIFGVARGSSPSAPNPFASIKSYPKPQSQQTPAAAPTKSSNPGTNLFSKPQPQASSLSPPKPSTASISLEGAQSQVFESQKMLVALNYGILNALRSADMHTDLSDMMRTYLSEAARLGSSSNQTSKNASFAASLAQGNKHVAEDSVAQSIATKDRTTELFPEKIKPTFEPSPMKSQTSNIFSSILSKPAAQSTPEAAPTPSTTTSVPPEAAKPANPFANLKAYTPAAPSTNLFTPQPAAKTRPPADILTSATPNMFGSKPSTQPSTNNLFSQNKGDSSVSTLFGSTSTLFGSTSTVNQESDAPNTVASNSTSTAQTAPGLSGGFKFTPPTTSSNPTFPFGKSTANDSATPSTAASSTKLPTFNVSGGTNFLAQFATNASKKEEEAKAKRKLEDFDSDEDDEAEWERLDAEKQAEKKRKVEEDARGKTLKFTGSGFSFQPASSAPASNDTPANKSSFSSANIFQTPKTQPTSNLFGQISQNQDTGSESGDPVTSIERDEQNNDAHENAEDSQEAGNDDSGDKGTEENTPEPSSFQEQAPAPNAGRSLFDRITPADTPSESSTPKPTTSSSSLFGASLNGTSSVFGSQGSPGDHTWKTDTPIKFGSSSGTQSEPKAPETATKTPVFKFQPPTPSSTTPKQPNDQKSVLDSDSGSGTKTPDKPIFNFGLFGATQQANPTPSLFSKTPATTTSSLFSNLSAATPTNGTPSLFNPKPTSNPQFNFSSALSKDHLSVARAEDSANTSRASSPGLSSDVGSINGDAPSDHEAETDQSQEQTDLTGVSSDEEIIFEQPSVKASLNEGKAWAPKGVGILRLLKNKDSGVYSVLLRMTPSGKIIFNSRLQKQLTFKDQGKGRVTLPLISKEGKVQSWYLALGKEAEGQAGKFVQICEEVKGKM